MPYFRHMMGLQVTMSEMLSSMQDFSFLRLTTLNTIYPQKMSWTSFNNISAREVPRATNGTHTELR
jgi:hypothetical protein